MAAVSDVREIISGDGEAGVDIVRNVRRWVDEQVIPFADALEHAGEFPTAMHRDMCEMGIFGITFPEAYGGLGLSFETYSAVIEEIARGWMGLAGIINTNVIDGWIIEQHGTDEQKQRFLPGLATGELQGCFTITEPNAGSDAQAIRTTATRDGDDYLLNGNKLFVTNGDRGDVYLAMTKTDPSANPRHRGISAFLVERDTPGFSMARTIDKLGYKGPETAELFMEDARVPAGNLLGGAEGRGFQQMISGLEIGRINVASRATGVAQAAFDHAIVYAQQARDDGQADRPAPGDPAEAGRYGDQDSGGATADPRRGAQEGQRRARGPRCWHGQAVRDRGRAGVHARIDARARRRRLHHGTADRAFLPRRPADGGGRRHERDSAHRDRAPAVGAIPRRLSPVREDDDAHKGTVWPVPRAV